MKLLPKHFLPCFLFMTQLAVQAAERVALVIGNNSYKSFPEAKQLTSPRADAEDLATGLKAIGFTVLAPVLDGTRDGIVKAKAQFLEQAKDAEIALFYFSGHGFQVGEENFLIPSDMPRITSYTVLKDNALMLRDSLMVGLEETGAKTKVIILDCCRDNPFAAQLEKALNGSNKSLRTKGGTGEISGYGPGFYLAFATSPGTIADDGNGKRNSPFTSALLTHLKDKAGENIRDLFDEVKETVRETSGVEQVPWTNDSLSKSHLKVLAKVNLPAVGAGMGKPAMPPVGNTAAPNKPNDAIRAAGPPATIVKSLDDGQVGDIYELKLSEGALMKFCYCPPGSFTMGSPVNEKGRLTGEDQKVVSLTKGFWMAQTECTQSQWLAVMGSSLPDLAKLSLSDRELHGEGDSFPMYFVNHKEVRTFCQRANKSVPKAWIMVLPTQTQWEYACRAGTTRTFSGAPDLFAWYEVNSGMKTHPVGTKNKNDWGFYDMHGNVSEWCADEYLGLYQFIRGGSWSSVVERCRSATRNFNEENFRSNDTGFRPALVPAKP